MYLSDLLISLKRLDIYFLDSVVDSVVSAYNCCMIAVYTCVIHFPTPKLFLLTVGAGNEHSGSPWRTKLKTGSSVTLHTTGISP